MNESYSSEPTESLNYWRKFFSCANADIFQVIKYAILVASVDCPDEFLSLRDQITEILYTCYSTQQCSSEDNDTQKESKETKSSNSSEENEPTISNRQSISSRDENSNLDEFEALTNEIEEEQETLGEVLRIKELLTNWRDESEKVISESLRRLQLMELSIETLSATQIGRVVSSLHKHKSKPIRQLAQTLVKGWKLLAEEWVTATLVSQEPSPVSVDPSPAQEETLLPSELDFPPLDMGALLATQPASFEFSKIFDGMDDDGNLTSNGELRKNRTLPKQEDTDSTRKENVENKKKEVVHGATKPRDTAHKASKPETSLLRKTTTCRNSEQRQKTEEQSCVLRKQELVAPKVPKPNDANCKASKPKDVSRTLVNERPIERVIAYSSTQQKQKSTGATSMPGSRRKDESKESEEQSYRAKLEVAKRKLQDRYEEANNAKRQRTIQVMELKDLPKQVQNKQQPIVKRGNYFKRSMNMKS